MKKALFILLTLAAISTSTSAARIISTNGAGRNPMSVSDVARAQLSGVQIVEVPEPGAIGLLALGGLALLIRKRR